MIRVSLCDSQPANALPELRPTQEQWPTWDVVVEPLDTISRNSLKGKQILRMIAAVVLGIRRLPTCVVSIPLGTAPARMDHNDTIKYHRRNSSLSHGLT